MSQPRNKFPDASGKSLDKCEKQYECSADSGFLSGEISEEIRDSGLIDDTEFKESNERLDSGIIDEKIEPEEMFVDSGVCLTDSFSRLNFRGQNDLNYSDKLQTPVESLYPKQSQLLETQDSPLMYYYTPDEDGDTHLHIAIEEGFVEDALALIRAAPYPELLEKPNNYGQTPLHLAVATGQATIARWLVVAGVKPSPRGFEGNSPLHIAALNDDVKSVHALAYPVQQEERDQLALSYKGHVCQPCEFNQWNYLGQTCVHVAAIHGHTEVLQHLVRFGANINAREGLMGYTALHYGVKQRDEALVQCLLRYNNIDVDVLTYGGRDVLEVNKVAPTPIKTSLRNRGVPSPFPSDEEESDSEDEMYESNITSMGTLVGASA